MKTLFFPSRDGQSLDPLPTILWFEWHQGEKSAHWGTSLRELCTDIWSLSFPFLCPLSQLSAEGKVSELGQFYTRTFWSTWKSLTSSIFSNMLHKHLRRLPWAMMIAPSSSGPYSYDSPNVTWCQRWGNRRVVRLLCGNFQHQLKPIVAQVFWELSV